MEGAYPPMIAPKATGEGRPLPFRRDKGRAQPLPSHFNATWGGFSPPPPVSTQHREGSPSPPVSKQHGEGLALPLPFRSDKGRAQPLPSCFNATRGGFSPPPPILMGPGEGSAPSLPFRRNMGRAAPPLPSRFDATRGGASFPLPFDVTRGGSCPSLPF